MFFSIYVILVILDIEGMEVGYYFKNR